MESVLAAIGIAAAILLTRGLFAALFARVHQPGVVAELCVGILVGSFASQALGLTHVTIALPVVKSILYCVSYPALIAFMFCLGYEVDVALLRQGMSRASSIGAWAIIVPFGLTYGLLALRLPWGIDTSSSTLGDLTVCTVIAVTAFPVMSRILEEFKLLGSRLGITALCAAGINDLFAWSLLAVLTALINRSAGSVGWYAVLSASFVAFIVLDRLASTRRLPSWTGGVTRVAMLAAGTAVAMRIGIDTVLVAYAAGVFLQRFQQLAAFMPRVRWLATALMPLFFVLSGMNATMAGALAAIPAAAAWTVWASLTKGGTSFLAARASGFDTQESCVVGALMNCRGVVSLVFLAVALRNGLITPHTYTVLLIVAVVTTLMTAPIIALAERVGGRRLITAAEQTAA